MRESADLVYKNHPIKFTVYIHDIDVTHDIDSYGNIEASLDYPQISEFRIGEANFVLRDYDETGKVGQKYNPEYSNNFFKQYGLQSGYKSPVRIEIHFLVDGEEKSSNNLATSSDPIILFEGKILSLNKGLKTGTVEVTCSDLTQEFRTQNADNFGIPKRLALAKGELSDRKGEYPVSTPLVPVSDDSILPVHPSQLKEVDRLKTSGALNKHNFVVTDRSIQLEDGFLEEDVTLSEDDEGGEEGVDAVHTTKDINPIIFFKSPYRNKRVRDLVKKIVAHYRIGNAEIEIPHPKLENRFFSNLGRVGYDFDKKNSRKKWRWEGYVTDFIYGQELANLDTAPFNHDRSDPEHDNLTNPLGLADGQNHFYTIQSSSPNFLGKGSFLYSIDTVTGRTAEAFEFSGNLLSTHEPVEDGLLFYEDKLLILAKRPGDKRIDLLTADPFRLNNGNRIDIKSVALIGHSSGLSSNQNEGGAVKSLVYHDEKLYLVRENNLWRIDLELEDNFQRGTLTKVENDFAAKFKDSPRIICAVSYDNYLYGIGKKTNGSSKLYRINHHTGQITPIDLNLPSQYSSGLKALNTYQGILYTLFDGQRIDEVIIKRNPYRFSSRNIYENSGGDKLFFLYSSSRHKTIPKIVEYDIETDTYSELYSHVRSQGTANEVEQHAEFWKITSEDYKTFYILGTEPIISTGNTDEYAGTEPYAGNTNKYFGVYDSSEANKSAPSRIKIWKFDRITLKFEVYIDHTTDAPSRTRELAKEFPLGKAPPQLGHYYHPFDVVPDSRKNFQVFNGNLYYIWANNLRVGVARASGNPPLITRMLYALTDKNKNSCGCDFVIDESDNKIYGAFTFVNNLHRYSTFNIYSVPL